MGINICPHILSSTLTSKIELCGTRRWTGISWIAMAACSPLPLWANFSKSIADCGPPNWSDWTCFQGWGEVTFISPRHSLGLDILLQNASGHICHCACPLYHCQWYLLFLMLFDSHFSLFVGLSLSGQYSLFIFLYVFWVNTFPVHSHLIILHRRLSVGHRAPVHRNVQSLSYVIIQP